MDDEFDLSSGEEAEMAALADKPLTRKFVEADAEDFGPPAKKQALSSTSSLAVRILKEKFGLSEFRLEQEAAISRLLAGNSTVVIFPTGGGKSLCYQVRLSTVSSHSFINRASNIGSSCCIC